MSSIARITEISSLSTESFDDAIRGGIERATATLRNVSGAYVKDQKVVLKDGKITGYQVMMQITFILDGDEGSDEE